VRTRCLALCAIVGFSSALLGLAAPGALARGGYVTYGTGGVSVLNTQTNQILGAPVAVGEDPIAAAITPDGRLLYVVNYDSDSVSVLDTQTNQVLGPAIEVGTHPQAIAIAPDGHLAYVANSASNTVSVIDTQTNQVSGPAITVGVDPTAIAITPGGRFAYVTLAVGSVEVIDLATRQRVGSPIAVGNSPTAIAITPNGSKAFVSNTGSPGMESETVSVIDTQTNQVLGPPIAVGEFPRGIAITPDGTRAYVAIESGESVAVIDAVADRLLVASIPVGEAPVGVAITPDGARAYVATEASKGITPINVMADQAEASILAPSYPSAVTILPNQGPLAAFSAQPGPAGAGTAFNAAASTDPDGSIARYDWSFGDGQSAVNGGPDPVHVYGAPGTYVAALTVTDNEGCSSSEVFTGQSAYCNGSAGATRTETITISGPPRPRSRLRLLRLRRHPRRGTATLVAQVSGAGSLVLSGRHVVKQRRVSSGGGVVKLAIRARGKAKRLLDRSGAVKVRFKITYLPEGAGALKRAKTITLKRRLR
jgi:YVTN family beta-propeller protein